MFTKACKKHIETTWHNNNNNIIIKKQAKDTLVKSLKSIKIGFKYQRFQLSSKP
jgi:hypothetical protein